MKNKIFIIIVISLDILLSPLTILSILWFKLIRKSSIARMNVSRYLFNYFGLLPIHDHYYEPLINPRKHLLFSLNDDRKLQGIDKFKIWPKSEMLTNNILKAFDDKIVMYRCLDNYGNTIAFRGYAYRNEIALDLFSVAVGEGRKNYASYYLFWTLIKDARSKGIKYYDLNGIDGYEGGVYNFKKGTGAEPIKYLGGFQWSTSKYLRILCDFVRYRKIKKI